VKMWKLFYGRSSPQMVLFTSTEDQNVPQQSLKWGGGSLAVTCTEDFLVLVFLATKSYMYVCVYMYTR